MWAAAMLIFARGGVSRCSRKFVVFGGNDFILRRRNTQVHWYDIIIDLLYTQSKYERLYTKRAKYFSDTNCGSASTSEDEKFYACYVKNGLAVLFLQFIETVFILMRVDALYW